MMFEDDNEIRAEGVMSCVFRRKAAGGGPRSPKEIRISRLQGDRLLISSLNSHLNLIISSQQFN